MQRATEMILVGGIGASAAPRLQALDVSDKRFEDPFLRKLSTAVSCVGSSPPVIVVAFAATLFVLLARCQLPLF